MVRKSNALSNDVPVLQDGELSGPTPPLPSIAYYDFYKINEAHSSTIVYNTEPSLTRQEFAEECDINSIMKRYETYNTGPNGLPNVRNPDEMMYIDYAEMPQDLMGYMTFMDNAQKSFMTLPAAVRREFDNNAIEFVAFASDPGNIDQMRSWGLAPPAKAPDPEPAPVPTPPAPDVPKGS